MPKITIDGKEIEVEAGTTIIRAAQKLGIEIPHYCYHPALSIAGQCRMCVVEVEKMPKLQISCATVVADGMVVRTRNTSERVRKAVQAALEFHLINHPLDCPVCDQAGECWLQDYYMEYGLYDSRFYEQKVRKKKAAQIGPHIMLDAERCILCSRCVRFCREVTGTGELAIFDRGDRSEIGIYPGKWVDNKYSGNLVDICPVGALTDRDFRFQCRVWYLEEADSICPGCATGCNIKIHYNIKRPHIANGRRVLRLKPRFNEHVNKWWICDEGRYGYKFIDDNRLVRPLLRGADGFREATWSDAIKLVSSRLREALQQDGPDSIGVIASPQLTNEELYITRKLFKDELGIKNIDFQVPPKGPGYYDDFLIKADKNPNTRGAQQIGLSPGDGGMSAEQIVRAAADGRLKILYVILQDLSVYGEDALERAARNVSLLVFQGSNANPTSDHAHVVLPSAVYAEKDGTFTNFAGRVQRIFKAIPPLGKSLPDWEIIMRLAEALGFKYPYQSAEEIFLELSTVVPAFAGMDYKKIGKQGMELNKG